MYERPNFSEKITTYQIPNNLKLLVGDATQLNSNPEIPNELDFIVIRHQQISGNRKIWLKIFQEALKKLKTGGKILFTSYSEIEHNMLIEELEKIGIKLRLSGTNNNSVKTSTPEVRVDNYYGLIEKI